MSRKAYWGRNSQYSQQGTIGISKDENVRIQYNGGACMSVSPLVAKIAIDRGEAKLAPVLTAPKKSKKKTT